MEMDFNMVAGFGIGMASFGAIVENYEKADGVDCFWISVPETSDDFDDEGNQMAGMHLAKRLKMFFDKCEIPTKIKCRVRDGDHWTKEKGEAATVELKASIDRVTGNRKDHG